MKKTMMPRVATITLPTTQQHQQNVDIMSSWKRLHHKTAHPGDKHYDNQHMLPKGVSKPILITYIEPISQLPFGIFVEAYRRQ